MCTAKDFEGMKLLPLYKNWVDIELDIWHKNYLPIKKNATVLDIGAGCGETAQFYLNHGAKRVIAVESDPKAFECLVHNFKDDSRVIPILAHIDNIKCDIEGSEEDMVVETHFPYHIVKKPTGFNAKNYDQVVLLKLKRNKGVTGKVSNLWNLGVFSAQTVNKKMRNRMKVRTS